jgi:hypothetical protein
MRLVRICLLASALVCPGTALAAAQSPAMPSEHRLSSAEIEKILADAAHKRELAELSDESLPPPIHGEVGFSIGTGGYRSAFGTAVVPLGGNGVAILSLGTDNFGATRFVEHGDR